MKTPTSAPNRNGAAQSPPSDLPDRVSVKKSSAPDSGFRHRFKPLIPAGGKPVTNELVNEIREELGI